MDDNSQKSLGKSILLVDDDQFILIAYKNGLESAGYSVDIAHNGIEALESMKSNKPDLVILELIMPKMNGFELLQAMQSSNDLKSVPALVLTNLSQESDEAEARSYGIVDFMVKANVSLKDLVLDLEDILN